jgi:hypothetical protein
MAGAATRKPTAILVVAAWHEGEPPRLAARITYTLDASRPSLVTVTAVGSDEITSAVVEWLSQAEAATTRRDAAVTDE